MLTGVNEFPGDITMDKFHNFDVKSNFKEYGLPEQ